MRRVLVSWIGHTDLRAPQESEVVGVGPVAQALMAGSFDDVFLLTDHEARAADKFVAWLQARQSGCALHVLHERLTGPTEFGEIYTTASRASAETREVHPAIPWPEIVGMRNRLVHAYFDIDLRLVWDTVKDGLPALIARLEPSVPPESG